MKALEVIRGWFVRGYRPIEPLAEPSPWPVVGEVSPGVELGEDGGWRNQASRWRLWYDASSGYRMKVSHGCGDIELAMRSDDLKVVLDEMRSFVIRQNRRLRMVGITDGTSLKEFDRLIAHAVSGSLKDLEGFLGALESISRGPGYEREDMLLVDVGFLEWVRVAVMTLEARIGKRFQSQRNVLAKLLGETPEWLCEFPVVETDGEKIRRDCGC